MLVACLSVCHDDDDDDAVKHMNLSNCIFAVILWIWKTERAHIRVCVIGIKCYRCTPCCNNIGMNCVNLWFVSYVFYANIRKDETFV